MKSTSLDITGCMVNQTARISLKDIRVRIAPIVLEDVINPHKEYLNVFSYKAYRIGRGSRSNGSRARSHARGYTCTRKAPPPPHMGKKLTVFNSLFEGQLAQGSVN